jgi:hypothetical protein
VKLLLTFLISSFAWAGLGVQKKVFTQVELFDGTKLDGMMAVFFDDTPENRIPLKLEWIGLDKKLISKNVMVKSPTEVFKFSAEQAKTVKATLGDSILSEISLELRFDQKCVAKRKKLIPWNQIKTITFHYSVDKKQQTLIWNDYSREENHKGCHLAQCIDHGGDYGCVAILKPQADAPLVINAINFLAGFAKLKSEKDYPKNFYPLISKIEKMLKNDESHLIKDQSEIKHLLSEWKYTEDHYFSTDREEWFYSK